MNATLTLDKPLRSETQARLDLTPVAFRFWAEIDVPGDIECVAIWAADYAEAMHQAADHASMPFKSHCTLGHNTAQVAKVDHDWDAVKLNNGTYLTRREFEALPGCRRAGQ